MGELLHRAALKDFPEPAQRFLAHALQPGAPPAPSTRLRMRGRIRVGAWLGFGAEWTGDGRSFVWSARAGWGPLRPLAVVDRLTGGTAEMDIRLFGRLPLVRSASDGILRSAAGRAAIEGACWAPGCLLYGGVEWHAASEDLIVASWSVPPERPDVHIELRADGAPQRIWADRWNEAERQYVPCGALVRSERRFEALTIPSHVSVGWGFGTPRFAPFFEAEIVNAVPTATPDHPGSELSL